MVSFIRRKGPLRINEVWFAKEKVKGKHADIISYMQVKEPFAYVVRKRLFNLHI